MATSSSTRPGPGVRGIAVCGRHPKPFIRHFERPLEMSAMPPIATKNSEPVPCAGSRAARAHGVRPVDRADLLVFVATNFIVGRCTASAIASASRKSFF